MICAKFGWNWLSGSGVKDFEFLQCILLFCNLLSPLGKGHPPSFEQTWIPFIRKAHLSLWVWWANKDCIKVLLRWWTSPRRPCPALPCRPPASVCSVAPAALYVCTFSSVWNLQHLPVHAAVAHLPMSDKKINKCRPPLSYCSIYRSIFSAWVRLPMAVSMYSKTV